MIPENNKTHRLQLLQMQFQYWLAQAQKYGQLSAGNSGGYDHLQDDALERAEVAMHEFERIYD